MKKIQNIILVFGLLFMIGIVVSANMPVQSSSSIYQLTDSGTITNAGNDTLTVPVNLISLWSYNWVVTATQTSGTTDIIAILQESNATSGAVWYEVERDTISGPGTVRLFGDGTNNYVYGLRQRLILDGSGTQVSPFATKLTLKKP